MIGDVAQLVLSIYVSLAAATFVAGCLRACCGPDVRSPLADLPHIAIASLFLRRRLWRRR